MNLSKEEIKTSTDLLSVLLADTYVLSVKTQNYHWNVKDSRFFILHEFFGKHYSMLVEAIDDIAERIRILGIHAPGSMAAFLKHATIEEAKVLTDGTQMLKDLEKGHLCLIEQLRKGIEKIEQGRDQGTLDFLIGRLQTHEKMAWMITSHIN